MSLFLYAVYLGGMVGNTDKKVGFWNRVFWPVLFGSAMVRIMLEKYKLEDLE